MAVLLELISLYLQVRSALAELTLDDAAVWVKEGERRKQPGHPKAPWFIMYFHLSMIHILPNQYHI